VPRSRKLECSGAGLEPELGRKLANLRELFA